MSKGMPLSLRKLPEPPTKPESRSGSISPLPGLSRASTPILWEKSQTPAADEKSTTAKPTTEEIERVTAWQVAMFTQAIDTMSAPWESQKPTEPPLLEEAPTSITPRSMSSMSTNALGSLSTSFTTRNLGSLRAPTQSDAQERYQTPTGTRPEAADEKPTPPSFPSFESYSRERSLTPLGIRQASASPGLPSFANLAGERSPTPMISRLAAADGTPTPSWKDSRARISSSERSVTPMGTRSATADWKPTTSSTDFRAPVPAAISRSPTPIKTSKTGVATASGKPTANLQDFRAPMPTAALSRSQTPIRAAAADEKSKKNSRMPTPIPATVTSRQRSPTPVQNLEDVIAWQTDVDSLEEQQVKLKQDQINLIHNQMNILKREIGDMQKKFMVFQTDLQAAQQEAHAALRLELAEHGNNALEMKAAWQEAHGALSKAMDEGLGSLAAEHAKAMENHKVWDSCVSALNEHAQNHGNCLTEMQDLHNRRYEEHSACLQKGLEDVHGSLQKELAELRSGHAVNLQKIVEDVTRQVDKLTIDVEQMACDLKVAQDEAHSALRLELAEGGSSAEEMKAAWVEAHNALSQAMDDGLGNLAAEHAKALEDHKAEQARALGNHAENLSSHGTSLRELEDFHNKRYEELQGTIQKETLQKEMEQLLERHADNLLKAVADLTKKVEGLTLDIEQLASDAVTAQDEGHAALRLELGDNVSKMKADWAALEADLRGGLEGHANNLRSLSETYNAKHAEHEDKLEEGLSDVFAITRDRLHQELINFKSGHTASLKDVLEDITHQLDSESELRKTMEIKLDQIFEKMRELMSVSFLGRGADGQQPASEQPTSKAVSFAANSALSDKTGSRPKSPVLRVVLPASGQKPGSYANIPTACGGGLQPPASWLTSADACAESPAVGGEQQAQQPNNRWQSPAVRGSSPAARGSKTTKSISFGSNT